MRFRSASRVHSHREAGSKVEGRREGKKGKGRGRDRCILLLTRLRLSKWVDGAIL